MKNVYNIARLLLKLKLGCQAVKGKDLAPHAPAAAVAYYMNTPADTMTVR